MSRQRKFRLQKPKLLPATPGYQLLLERACIAAEKQLRKGKLRPNFRDLVRLLDHLRPAAEHTGPGLSPLQKAYLDSLPFDKPRLPDGS